MFRYNMKPLTNKLTRVANATNHVTPIPLTNKLTRVANATNHVTPIL